MSVGRFLAWLCILLALMAAGAELVRSLEAGNWQPLALGYLWFSIDAGSLNLVQAVVQRYLHPVLWDPAIVWLLRWPAWLFFGLIGGLLMLATRGRRRRRWFSR